MAGAPARFTLSDESFSSFADMHRKLKSHGCEGGAQVILGVDMTGSNNSSGKRTHGGRSLHAPSEDGTPSPYAECISTLCGDFSELDPDREYNVFGFGCSRTQDKKVFNFAPAGAAIVGLQAALSRYNEIVSNPALRLAGPTTFGRA